MEKSDKTADLIREMTPYSAEVLNPFHLDQKLTILQLLKVVFLSVTLLPLRLLLMLFFLVCGWLLSLVTLLGMPEEQARGLEPLSGWRRKWAKPLIVSFARLMFVVGGWVWIPHKGRRASAREAPILLVMPHSSFLDTAVVIALGCPGMVVKDSTTKAPFFGDMIKCSQPFYVRSEDPDARRRIGEDIRQRVHSRKDFEQVLIFPEGGCGNRKALLQFKLGGFAPGVPVQPVFIRYRNKLDTITWTWDGPGALKQLWLSLSQFRIYCELEFLPVYSPTQHEKENSRLFARNVQNYVSRWIHVPASRFSVEDARFLKVARNLHLPLTAAMIKLLRLRHAIGRQNTDPGKELLSIEEKRNDTEKMQGDVKHMAHCLGLQRCPEALKDFYNLLDQHRKESLDVRIYDAGLCLLRQDLSPRGKIKAAFQVFGSEIDENHLTAILLLWNGIPYKYSSFSSLLSFDKFETADAELCDAKSQSTGTGL
ncbi:lysophosphatidylcholine acyltransferase 1-like [Stegodyphus dumicola]|uniref:lysophosphatidylcholine acyltransferase 1-like n=1 Tax=Stegodyphus dumicola TaxID=202533 RepID=UPI0015ACC57D|nr:lysophosphatidylcholine acyltransferase 1-like [Stegodyphus dumicola]